MTINSDIRQAGPYIGTGLVAAFPFAFKIFSAFDVLAVRADANGAESTLTLGTHYSISLNGDQDANPGGVVTLTSALASGYKLTITSSIPALQSTDLTNQGGFYPKVITSALDKLTVLIQQVLNGLSRSLKFPISESSVSATMPPASQRANKYLAFDASGNPVLGSGTGADAGLRADLAASSGASLVGFSQSGTPPAEGTAAAKMQETISVKDRPFLAKGDGVSDDTTAIQAAINYAASSGKALHFPAGVYLVTSALNVTLSGDTPLVLVGDGSSGLSELRMNTGGNGLNITLLGSWWQGLSGVNSTGIRISNMSFTTTNVNAGIGINITGSCVAGRPSPQIIFDGCDFKSATSMSQYWDEAVSVVDAGECWFDACRFIIGGTSNSTGVGVALSGSSQANSPVHFYFDNCDFTYGGQQLKIGDYIEGVYVSQCNMIAGDTGINWHATEGESGLHIVGGHFSHKTAAIDLDNIFDFEVVGALIYRGSTAYAYTGILLATCGRFSITGNVFVGLNDATFAETGAYVLSVPNNEEYGGVIANNSFHGFASRAIWLGVNSNYVYVGENLFRQCALRILNQQGQYNNTVRGAQFAGNRVFTLTGGAATEVIDIPIPAGVFRTKPGGGVVMGSGAASAVLGSYDYDSASSTDLNARCTLRLVNGGVISAGSSRIAYILFEDEDTSI